MYYNSVAEIGHGTSVRQHARHQPGIIPDGAINIRPADDRPLAATIFFDLIGRRRRALSTS